MEFGETEGIKDLEKERKIRQTPMMRDGLGAKDALIDEELEAEIRTMAAKVEPQSTIKKISEFMGERTNLSHNPVPLLKFEALMCVLVAKYLLWLLFPQSAKLPITFFRLNSFSFVQRLIHLLKARFRITSGTPW